MEISRWTERTFAPIHDNGLLPGILERLTGTPARLKEKLEGVSKSAMEWSANEKWSIKEEVGHLGDLEPLWLGRLDDFIQGLETLRAADMSNRKTYEAGHNRSSFDDLLMRFKESRHALAARIKAMDHEYLEKTCLHPRLQRPMKVVDLAYFVAEHDDHHLARITSILETKAKQTEQDEQNRKGARS